MAGKVGLTCLEPLRRDICPKERAVGELAPEKYPGIVFRTKTHPYELKWKTIIGYAKALHNAAIWHRYDYLADAKRMFKMVRTEYEEARSRWVFSRWFFRELADIGIKEIDFIEPLRDLEALELQMVYTNYALSGNDMAIERLPASLLEFQQRYLLDKEALSKRLEVDDRKLSAGIAQLQSSISKLEKPVLRELDDGNFVVVDVDHRDMGEFRFNSMRWPLGLEQVNSP